MCRFLMVEDFAKQSLGTVIRNCKRDRKLFGEVRLNVMVRLAYDVRKVKTHGEDRESICHWPNA
jgi:hypothetical protein